MKKENVFDRGLEAIQTILTILTGTAMIITTILIVIWRYILNAPLTWGEEAARYLTVWFIYIGIAVASKRKAHLGVEAFTLLLPLKARHFVNCVAGVVSILLMLFLTYCGIKMAMQYASTNQVSTMLRIPMTIIFGIVPVGLIISTYHYIRNLIEDISTIPTSTDREEN